MARVQRVFISYRREDAVHVAGRVRDWLVRTWKLTPENVFMDLSTILPGADFEQVIDQEIAKCDAMIIIMSPSWITQVNTAEISYPRLEAETAIRRGLHIIPAMVELTTTPTAKDLPESLRPLLRRNIRPIRPDSFDYDMEWVRKALGVRTISRTPLVATLFAFLLIAAAFGTFSQVPAGNPVWRAFHTPITTHTGQPIVDRTFSPTKPTRTPTTPPPSPTTGPPGQAHSVATISGFYTQDDGYRHAIVATIDGKLSEVFYGPSIGLHVASLTTVSGIVSIGGFYTPDDGYRHVIVATNDGKVSDVYYSPSIGVHVASLTTVSGIVSIAGFYTPDDGYRHAIVATSDGKVSEVFYGPSIGVHVASLTSVSGIVSIGGFYTPDDGYRHVIVATYDGKVSDVYYSPSIGVKQAPLGNM